MGNKFGITLCTTYQVVSIHEDKRQGMAKYHSGKCQGFDDFGDDECGHHQRF